MVATYDSVIEQIAQSVFSTMLNIDLARVDEPVPADHDWLLATVHIAGEWTGSVMLALPELVAIEAAAAMLQVNVTDVTAADQEDVASELVNMIGGNLKSMLPGPSYLSLPTIVSGSDFGQQVHDAQLLDDVVLACNAGLLRMRLYTRLAAVESST
jgi:chemotaxis protein CheX